MTQKPKVPAKAKPAAKRKISTKPKTEKKAAAPKVNTHIEAGVKFERYNGPSKGANGLRPVKIMVREPRAELTDRARQNLYALRDKYKQNQFEAKGLDNGILRDLLAAGLVTLNGGQKEVRDGREYIMDGATPVVVKINAAGMKYGAA